MAGAMVVKRFRVAFSFAGEKRNFVAQVAALLANQFGESAILYDKFHESEFARFNLGIYLPKLYGEQSELIIPVLCPNYDLKQWTGWEWVSIYNLLTKADGHRVMPSRFDYAKVDGLTETAGFIELDDKTPQQFATLILERLALNEGLSRNFYTSAASIAGNVPSQVVETKQNANDFEGGAAALNEIGVDPARLTLRKLIHDTPVSKVSIYAGQGSQYVLKRTQSELCQLATLRRLVNAKDIGGHDALPVSIGLPLAVWNRDGFVYEFRQFHKGITLEEAVLRNRFRIRGEFLARFHNAFVRALFDLHKLGIVHRDIQPRNILLTDTHGVVLLDSTLACVADSDQVAVDSVYFTAPEQLVGRASPASDFYSLGAVEFFMANGFPPGTCSATKYVRALQNIDFGGWRSPWSSNHSDDSPDARELDHDAQFVAGLLSPNAKDRPTTEWDLMLRTGTRPVYELSRDARSILDLGECGFLACGRYDFGFLDRNNINKFLVEVLANAHRLDDSLQKSIEAHLAGNLQWKI